MELARVRDLARADGMRPLIRLLERRIARPLSDTERTGLAARVDLVGPERLGDVVRDLSPNVLAAWIAAPTTAELPAPPGNSPPAPHPTAPTRRTSRTARTPEPTRCPTLAFSPTSSR